MGEGQWARWKLSWPHALHTRLLSYVRPSTKLGKLPLRIPLLRQALRQRLLPWSRCEGTQREWFWRG